MVQSGGLSGVSRRQSQEEKAVGTPRSSDCPGIVYQVVTLSILISSNMSGRCLSWLTKVSVLVSRTLLSTCSLPGSMMRDELSDQKMQTILRQTISKPVIRDGYNIEKLKILYKFSFIIHSFLLFPPFSQLTFCPRPTLDHINAPPIPTTPVSPSCLSFCPVLT